MYWRFVAPTLAIAAPEDTTAVTATLEKGSVDAGSAAALLTRAKAAANKAGINWDATVDGCRRA